MNKRVPLRWRWLFLCVIKQVDDLHHFKRKALQWAASFGSACYLDSNNFNDPYSKFDTLIACGAHDEICSNSGSAFDEFEQFRAMYPGWITGFFGYDLKNEIEHLSSSNPDHLHFPDLYFFAPKYLIIIKGDEVNIIANDPEFAWTSIAQQNTEPVNLNAVELKARFTRDEYIEAVHHIQQHITRGDIYVTNFCQEFYADGATIDPLGVFLQLDTISPNPFSSFYKWKNNYILCASPERFLGKRSDKLISQPIKGTAKRGATAEEDEAIKQELRTRTKELQENVMIVDLVRNDLTRSAKQATVKTEELFGIYTFNQLHQMISTVVCELESGTTAIQAIRNTFPMGSMTGAPKISAMRLMERYERSKRGVYSGAIGYMGPDDDFDFNVVIRTLLYNADKQYLSFHAGSAITYHADAGQEYDECLLKAKAVLQVLGQKLA